MMTRFLGLGFTVAQVVTMCTANPARAIGEEQRLGRLAPDFGPRPWGWWPDRAKAIPGGCC